MKLIYTLKLFGHVTYFNDLNPIKFFFEICFMAQNMTSFGKCAMWSWKEYIF